MNVNLIREIKTLLHGIRHSLIRSVFTESFSLINLFLFSLILWVMREDLGKFFYVAVGYISVFFFIRLRVLVKSLTYLTSNELLKNVISDEEVKEYFSDSHSYTGKVVKNTLVTNLLMRSLMMSENIESLKSRLSISKNLTTIFNKQTMKILFTMSIMVTIHILTMLSFLVYYSYGNDFYFDTTLFFLVLRWTIVGVLLLMAVFSYIIYKIIWGGSPVIICSTCRRIKWNNQWYTIENFVGKASHDMCSVCAETMRMHHGNQYEDFKKCGDCPRRLLDD